MGKTIQEQEEILFKKWLDIDNIDSIIKDGVVNETTFQNIVFVLKEVNGGIDWDLREHLREGGQGKTWNNIVRWTQGILNIDEEHEIPWSGLKYITAKDRQEILPKICAMNVKKTAGTGTANNKKIYEFGHVEEHLVLLQEQMELYKPSIIVCCGMGADMFSNIFHDHRESQTSNGIYYRECGEIILINYYHPNAHISAFTLYTKLVDAIKEIKESRKHN